MIDFIKEAQAALQILEIFSQLSEAQQNAVINQVIQFQQENQNEKQLPTCL